MAFTKEDWDVFRQLILECDDVLTAFNFIRSEGYSREDAKLLLREYVDGYENTKIRDAWYNKPRPYFYLQQAA